MKKYLISLLLVGIAFPCAFAQQISLTFFSGYTFAEKFEADEIYGRIDDGYQWGIGIENAFNAENAIEVNYQNMVSGVWYRRIFTQYEGDLSTNYLMAGYMRKARFQDNFYGFGVMQADAVWFIPDRSLASDEVVRPAFGARAGFRFQPTSHV
ncbi:MAG: hypothetical protein NZL95_02630, partial [Chitinophagales bacterium]|nr:hypothetical protein [Chitinophagales bacterium]MDW8427427.1 hypothetical protein [Chitinophagales bacterium]